MVERERFDNCVAQFGTFWDRFLVRHFVDLARHGLLLRPPKRFLHLHSEGVPAVPFQMVLAPFCLVFVFFSNPRCFPMLHDVSRRS